MEHRKLSVVGKMIINSLLNHNFHDLFCPATNVPIRFNNYIKKPNLMHETGCGYDFGGYLYIREIVGNKAAVKIFKREKTGFVWAGVAFNEGDTALFNKDLK